MLYFLEQLNKLTKEEFTAPHEAQWEYAARGGQKSNNFIYSGSNTIDEVAWFAENSNKMMHSVAQKKPNELGLYDMTGNVWEWCSNFYYPYCEFNRYDRPAVQPINPLNYRGSTYYILRGGSWGSKERYCPSTHRFCFEISSNGVRCRAGMRLVLQA